MARRLFRLVRLLEASASARRSDATQALLSLSAARCSPYRPAPADKSDPAPALAPGRRRAAHAGSPPATPDNRLRRWDFRAIPAPPVHGRDPSESGPARLESPPVCQPCCPRRHRPSQMPIIPDYAAAVLSLPARGGCETGQSFHIHCELQRAQRTQRQLKLRATRAGHGQFSSCEGGRLAESPLPES